MQLIAIIFHVCALGWYVHMRKMSGFYDQTSDQENSTDDNSDT